MAPKPSSKRGYKATREADGTFVVHRVPIFVECKRNDVEFGKKWISEAVSKAKAWAREGYFPPLHIRHHDIGLSGSRNEDVRPAGFFQIVGTKQITFQGEAKTAVLADLHITDPMVQQDVVMKRLPYRSIEIHDVDTPAIDSLALLDHEVPYLQLPMLMVSDVKEEADDAFDSIDVSNDYASVAFATVRNPWAQKKPKSDSGMLVCFQRGHAAHLIFQENAAMDDEANAVAEENVETSAEETQTEETTDALNFEGAPPIPPKEGESATPAPSPESASDEDKDSEDTPKLDTQTIVQAIADGSISVADMDAICAAVEQRKAATEGQQQPQMPHQPTQPQAMPAPAAVPGGEAMSATEGKKSVEMAALEGKLAALEAKDAERDAREQRTRDVGVAMQRLEGRPLGADLEEKLLDYHEKHGPEAFAAHVESMATAFGALPSPSGDRTAAFLSQAQEAPASAMRFQASGTDAVERATKFAQEWQELNRHGAVSMSEERYVDVNMGGAPETPAAN